MNAAGKQKTCTGSRMELAIPQNLKGIPVDKITALLIRMGDSPDEVAEKLRKAEVKGLRDSPSVLNPIVRYLNRSLDIGGRMEVGADGTMLRLYRKSKVQEMPLPLPVQVFLDGFHRGLYPDLEIN